jgi:hypothetical protein
MSINRAALEKEVLGSSHHNDNGIPVSDIEACIICVCQVKISLSHLCAGSCLTFFMMGLQSPPEGSILRNRFFRMAGRRLSFAKCHFEESVPTDLFNHTRSRLNSFRYARLWTRGGKFVRFLLDVVAGQ